MEEQLDLICQQLDIPRETVATIIGCTVSDLEAAASGANFLPSSVREKFAVLLASAEEMRVDDAEGML